MNCNTPLVITGMHRSGTSLLAKFIYHSGIDLGDKLLGAKPSNIYGHYEDIEILRFHRDILEREFKHQMWVPGLPRLTAVDWDRGRALIASRKQKSHWGWKEPRTCLFLHLWNKLLPEAFFLFIVRHPLLVLDSLSRRIRTRFYHILKHNLWLKSWLIYNQACYEFFLDHRSRCILFTLSNTLEYPAKAISLLSEKLQFKFSEMLFRASYDINILTKKTNRYLFVSPFLQRKSLQLYRKLSQDADV